MKSYPLPASFSGRKFAARYGLNSLALDFWADEFFIYVPDNLPDDPPIFEADDPPGPTAALDLSGVAPEDNVLKLPADAVEPTGGGGAAAGRIRCSIGGVTRYISYY